MEDFLKKIFHRKKPTNSDQEQFIEKGKLSQEKKLKLTAQDLIKMGHKLVGKREFRRAEQLLRDAVQETQNDPEIWWLLFTIAEPLKRFGRAYYCLERIQEFDPENEQVIEKLDELKQLLDKQIDYYIEYKLAPDFYKLTG